MHIPFKRTTGRTDAADNPCPLRSDAFLRRAMDAWGDTVYRVALAQTGSPSDADDVYQDVFMRLLEHTAAFESDEHLKAWLLRVTINRCRDLAKSNWNRHTVAFDPVRDDIAELVRDPRDADVWDAVGQLPDNLRSSVHLHYVEGYTTDEIARMLHSQPATVRTWLSRARARVKDLLTRESERTGAHAALPSVVPDPRTHRDQRKEVPHD